MTKELVTYTLALELKELGFDEPCIAVYEPQEIGVMLRWVEQQKVVSNKAIGYTIAPLYQQAFRFFREKYDLEYNVQCVTVDDSKMYVFNISDLLDYVFPSSRLESKYFIYYEEAEFECLKKLIEIVKKNN